MPLRTATEFANKLIRGLVAARRIVNILAIEPEVTDPADPLEEPAAGDLVDHQTGVTVPPGTFLALVSELPQESAAVADRLGRYAEGKVTLGGVRLADLPRDVVRRRILVSDSGSIMFSGVLSEELDLRGTGDGAALAAALHASSAEDVVDALPEGLAADVEERGRSFSGGQRQRLVLARALAADPDILVLVDPTSAVDAHTESTIAGRLHHHRSGRTTVVTTTSPLLLDRADQVAFLEDGVVVSEGTHRQLLATDPRYQRVVTRGEDE
jgi:ABC-type multidrug transport system fused ATPase/permease subunit